MNTRTAFLRNSNLNSEIKILVLEIEKSSMKKIIIELTTILVTTNVGLLVALLLQYLARTSSDGKLRLAKLEVGQNLKTYQSRTLTNVFADEVLISTFTTSHLQNLQVYLLLLVSFADFLPCL